MSKRTSAWHPQIQQACVIPFRRSGATWQFCIITSVRKKRWIFPKGIVEADETLEVAGLKEAWEEAGLTGQIVGEPIGRYRDRKWGSALEVNVMLMHVEQVSDEWPESDCRKRRWVAEAEALERIQSRTRRDLLVRAARVLESWHASADDEMQMSAIWPGEPLILSELPRS